jgi:HEPN domain-containing protein
MSAEMAAPWVRKARSDLLDADNNIKAEEIPTDTVCFHCQQAAEKMLKAILAFRDSSVPRTHDLLALLQSVQNLGYQSTPIVRDACITLNPFAVETRYPDDAPTPTMADVLEARKAANEIEKWSKTFLPAL